MIYLCQTSNWRITRLTFSKYRTLQSCMKSMMFCQTCIHVSEEIHQSFSAYTNIELRECVSKKGAYHRLLKIISKSAQSILPESKKAVLFSLTKMV